ncbi:acyl carrier protein [bacterium]|nr:acyl carrier protein [bacterium]
MEKQSNGGRKVKEEIIKIIAGIAEVPEKSINENTNLLADLDLESLDLVTLISEIETKYELEIPDKEIKKIQTVGDIINYLSSHV